MPGKRKILPCMLLVMSAVDATAQWQCIPDPTGGWECFSGSPPKSEPPAPVAAPAGPQSGRQSPTQPPPGLVMMTVPPQEQKTGQQKQDPLPTEADQTAAVPQAGVTSAEGSLPTGPRAAPPPSDATTNDADSRESRIAAEAESEVTGKREQEQQPIHKVSETTTPPEPLIQSIDPVDAADQKTIPESDLETDAIAAAILQGRIDFGLQWDQCALPSGETPLSFDAVPEDTTVVETDDAEFRQQDENAVFSGNVIIRRGSRMLEANRVEYNKADDILDASGGIYFEQPGLRLTSSAGQFELGAERGQAENVEYRLIDRSGRGQADSVEIESGILSHYRNITYSTCRPGEDDWLLQAKELDVDRSKGEGTAHHATVSFKGVPFAYLPYINFPIDDRRKSGFLAPSIGTSSSSGLELEIPYYFNIAPQMDATLTPRIMSKRGLMLNGEFRYMTENQEGKLRAGLLPDDRDAQEGEDSTRGGVSFQSEGNLAPDWSFDTNLNYVSDSNYLDDFGRTLEWTSARNLERRGELKYSGNDWSLLGRLQQFQTVDKTIDTADRPYSRLPQFLLDLNKPNQFLGLSYHLRSEYVHFDHDSDEVADGDRIDLHPALSMPLRRPWGFLTPKASLRYTTYNLSNQIPGESDTPDRTIPSFSLDGGLYFERGANWFGNTITQTLEPRLFYLLTPNKNQDDLPDFDTANLDISFFSLFRENRFSGSDRVGDANQLTTALTTRILNNTSGTELFRGSFGQIVYFRDRKVNLPPVDTEEDDISSSLGAYPDDSSSSLVAEVVARMGRDWRTRGNIFWNPHQKETAKASYSIHYLDPQQRILNLGYRFDRGDFNKTEVSGRWPLTNKLHTVLRWDYSLKYSKTMGFFAGFEYESCCWIGRLVAQQLLTDPDGDPEKENSIFLQLELKGLTSFGSKIDEFLERGILGYQTE